MHFANALLPEGWAIDVRADIVDGRFARIARDTPAYATDRRLGTVIPGLSNLHSHAFQRAMAGLTEQRGVSSDSFWSWRELMYRFLDRLTPDDVRVIAALAYVEMLEAGFIRVGEFHYLHHDPTGAAYEGAAMASALTEAAGEAGIALTLLPVFYAHSGFGGLPPEAIQRRFITTLDGFLRLHEASATAIASLPDANLGVAPHSLRAVTAEELTALLSSAGSGPVHIHIAEQRREVDACRAWSGMRPVEWLLNHAPVDTRWCLVHATHMNDAETQALARSGAVAGLCPITEANLGDGLFPAPTFHAAEGRYGVGSDSNVRIDAAEELRWLEYGQRLSKEGRNLLVSGAGASTGGTIFRRALAGGAQALGVPFGIAEGLPADFVTLDEAHPSLAATRNDRRLDGWIFAAGQSAIDGVWRRGRQVVASGRHHQRQSVVDRYNRLMQKLLP